MKVELHVNGVNEVILTPETDIERVVLKTMADSASKGRAVSMTADWSNDVQNAAGPSVPLELRRAVIGVPA